MASVVGGGLVFSTATQTVILGLSNAVGIAPNPVAGDLNIEVFTQAGLTTLPTLDTVGGVAFNQGILDPGGFDQSDGTLFRDPVTLFGGAYLVSDDGFPPAVIQLGSGAQSVVGATGDTLIGGTGATQALNGEGVFAGVTVGAESIVGGTGGSATLLGTEIFGGRGDTIRAGASGTTYIDGSVGDMQIFVGASGSETIFGSFQAAAFGAGPDTITGGGADVQVQAVGSHDVLNFGSETGNVTINALALGPVDVTMTLGSGGAVVFGGPGDTVTFGSGAQYFDGEAGSALINIGGAGGSDTIFGSTVTGSPDTLVGGAANVEVQGLGKGDLVQFAGESGTSLINALSGNIAATFGSGAASVYAGAGDTISFGSGNGYGDGLSGDAFFNLGPSGTDTVYGSSVQGGGAGDTIISTGAANLNYNTEGGGGDLLNLGQSTGNATINAFHFGGQVLGFNDTIIASQGSDQIFGGDGDRIGVANAHTTAFNDQLWTHGDGSETIGSVLFGTNDTASGTSYDTVGGKFNVDTTVGSNAQVTIGGGAGALLGNFQPGNDFLFYQGESAATNSAIVATAQAINIGGVASSQIALPDGTVMTLVGVTPGQLTTENNLGTLFKA